MRAAHAHRQGEQMAQMLTEERLAVVVHFALFALQTTWEQMPDELPDDLLGSFQQLSLMAGHPHPFVLDAVQIKHRGATDDRTRNVTTVLMPAACFLANF